MTEFTLEALDQDGAIQEAMDAVSDDSRADFLRKALFATGGLVGGGAVLAAMAEPAHAATRRDVQILNFALTLEYLEAAFYTEAVAMGALTGRTLQFARIVGAHERTHVRFLQGALGSAAVKRPRFNFRGTTENAAAFRSTAIVLEDTGVAAYAGQAPRIQTTAVLQAALSVHSVEARHASWIRHISGVSPAPSSFDRPLTMNQVLAAVGQTRFIVPAARRPRPRGGSRPGFTG
jgi:hypothetical protein